MKREALNFAVIFFSLAMSNAASAVGETKVVCTKPSEQPHLPLLRTEVITDKNAQIRFEYGIGDAHQIYELYYFSAVVRTAPNVYETIEGVNPHLRVEVRRGRQYKELQFILTNANGAITKREGYRCE